MAIDIPSSSGSNLSSLRKFMDNFMSNLLEMGMSLDQARAQSKIWLDRQMQEYAKSLENQKTMEEIRTRNDYGLLGARTTAEAAAAKTAYQRNLVEKYFDPRYYEKLPQGNLQAISALKSALPEEAWQETGFVYSPEIEQKISEATKAGTIGIDDLQNLRKTDPNTLTTIVRTFGFDRAIELAKGTLGGTEANVRNALTDKGFSLEQQRINLGLAQLAAKEPGAVKTGKLSDVDKAQIAEIDKSQAFVTGQWQAGVSGKVGGIDDNQLASLATSLLGSIRNEYLEGKPVSSKNKNFINNIRNVDQINATGKLPEIDSDQLFEALGGKITPENLNLFAPAPPTQFVPASGTARTLAQTNALAARSPAFVATPAPVPATPAYKYTATNASGQVAGSNDGITWYDVRTGQIIK